MFNFFRRKKTTNEPKRLVQRGYNIYHIAQVMPISGIDKHGDIQHGEYELPWFTLSPYERIEISKKSSFIFGMVTNRMNRIGSLDFAVVPEKEDLDKKIAELKRLKSIHADFINSGLEKYVMAAQLIRDEIAKTLVDVMPDLSNFNRALVRYNRKITAYKSDHCHEIEDWLMKPNKNDNFEDIVKKYVYDLLIHGTVNLYKERNQDNIITRYHILPGGSVYPLRAEYVTDFTYFAQVVPGLPTLIYDKTEIVSDSYAPTSANEYGLVPLDAVVNKVSEQLLSEAYWAGQADGTAPPEKIIAIEDRSQIPGLPPMPMDPKEQKRIESTLNQYRKAAVRTITGTGPIAVLDISKRDMMAEQLDRIREIKKDMALVFNMTNMEINESGSDATSGRETSEAQKDQEKQKGTYPIIKSFQEKITYELITPKFGPGCRLKLKSSNDEYEQLELIKAKMETGVYSPNQILEEDLNREPFEGEKYNFPPEKVASMNEALAGEMDKALGRRN